MSATLAHRCGAVCVAVAVALDASARAAAHALPTAAAVGYGAACCALVLWAAGALDAAEEG